MGRLPASGELPGRVTSSCALLCPMPAPFLIITEELPGAARLYGRGAPVPGPQARSVRSVRPTHVRLPTRRRYRYPFASYRQHGHDSFLVAAPAAGGDGPGALP